MPTRELMSAAAVVLVATILAGAPAHAQYRIGSNFQGSTYAQSTFTPPDTEGAVGPDHYVELINGRFAVYSKADGSVAQSRTLDQFFIAAGVVPSFFSFDPRIAYDAPSQRWFALAADNPGLANSFLLAVSTTSDPTQAWRAFRIDSDTNNDTTADFPMLGVSSDGVFISANMYALFTADVNVTFITIPKADLLLPTPTVANLRRFENVDPFGTGYTVQPVVNLDNTGMPYSLLSAFNLPAGSLKRTRFTGTIQAPVLSTTGGFINVSAATDPPAAPQPPMPIQKPPLDAGAADFGGMVVRRGGNLWAVTGINVAGRAAIRWYRIDDTTLAVRATGTISHPTLSLYFPSIGVNPNLDVVIGCSGSSSTQPVSAYAFVGRTTGTVTTFGGPILLRAGLDDFALLDEFGRNRWGDYSATNVDPLNPAHFWTIQEFVVADNVWATQITEIIVTSCLCDWNTDGRVTSQDFFEFMQDFFATPPHADYNADGATNSQDFFAFLACFFTACL